MRSRRRSSLRSIEAAVLAAGFLCFSAALEAQVNATGTFSGLVVDPAGNGVGKARVRLTDQQTGVWSTRFTAADGHYVFPLVRPGIYSIEVSTPGFAVVTRRDLGVHIDEVIQQDFQLQVAGAKQEITVTGAAPLLNTETTEVGNVISQYTTEQLPLNGRNFRSSRCLSREPILGRSAVSGLRATVMKHSEGEPR